MSKFRHWRGFGITVINNTQKQIVFELDLLFPVNNYFLQDFLRRETKFVYEGNLIEPLSIFIPDKIFWGIAFNIKVE